MELKHINKSTLDEIKSFLNVFIINYNEVNNIGNLDSDVTKIYKRFKVVEQINLISDLMVIELMHFIVMSDLNIENVCPIKEESLERITFAKHLSYLVKNGVDITSNEEETNER